LSLIDERGVRMWAVRTGTSASKTESMVGSGFCPSTTFAGGQMQFAEVMGVGLAPQARAMARKTSFSGTRILNSFISAAVRTALFVVVSCRTP
jgi:hypothetical protein